MSAIASMIEILNWMQDAFYKAYLEILDWPWPFWYGAYPFYELSSYANQLAWAFYDFYYVVMHIESKVNDILDWPFIFDKIMLYFPYLEAINEWFTYWWQWVDGRIRDWWAGEWANVKSWSDSVRSWAWWWIENIYIKVNALTSTWNTFVTVTLPTLPNWLDIEALIRSWFTSFTPFWQGWQDWRDKVIEFFTDPEDWLYKSADRIIERYW